VNSGSVYKIWKEVSDRIVLNQSDKIRLNSIIGNRGRANKLAAQVDRSPFGPIELLIVTRYCLCGAPFDIEVTPNFKKRIIESGVPWPPTSPIKYPLKNW